MKVFIIFLFIIMIGNIRLNAQSGDSIIPKEIHLQIENISSNDSIILNGAIEQTNREYSKIYKIQKCDLNKDGTFEYFLYVDDGSGYGIIRLVEIFENHYNFLGDFKEINIYFAEYKNGFPQIVQKYFWHQQKKEISIYSYQDHKYVLNNLKKQK